ncbi:MAG: hypothetical protein AB7F43_08295 [Bacteriovoracia bacterium]
MERRKDTPLKSSRLPGEYLKMVENLFQKNFKKLLLEKEKFVASGELFPDELVLSISLKHDAPLLATTCYASVDYPPEKLKKENGEPAENTSETVQFAVGICVDVIASFFQTYFDDGRPVDYENEYRQHWTRFELEKGKPVFIMTNRDNLELDAQADAILEEDEEKSNRKIH